MKFYCDILVTTAARLASAVTAITTTQTRKLFAAQHSTLSAFAVSILGVSSFVILPTSSHAATLLDNGFVMSSETFLVSGSNDSSGGFTLFQPFSIVDPAWAIDSIGFYGEETFISDGSGVVGTLFPDLVGSPDESQPIASDLYFLPTAGSPGLVVQLFDVALPQGAYWFVYSAASPDSSNSVFFGTNGENVFSRRGADGSEFSHGPASLRITGQIVPEPSTFLLAALGLLGLYFHYRQIHTSTATMPEPRSGVLAASSRLAPFAPTAADAAEHSNHNTNP